MEKKSKTFVRIPSCLRDKDVVVFVAFLLYGALVFAPFLRGEQRVHDSFLVEHYAGYERMIRGLFSQGRVLSSWLYQVLHVFNPSHTLTMRLSVAASLVFLSLAAYIVFRLLRQYAVSTEEKGGYVFAALGALMLCFNLFIAESMLFFENAVMSLGILLAVLAVALFLRGGRKHCLLGLLALVLSVFSYQPSSVFFPPLIVLFLGARYHAEWWKFFRRVCLAVLMYAAAVFSNVAFLLLYSSDVRFASDVRIWDNMRHAVGALRLFFLNQFGFFRDYMFLLFLAIFFAVLIFTCHRQRMYRALFVSILSVFALLATTVALHLPIASDLWYIAPRSAVAVAGIGGLLLLAIALFAKRIRLPILAIALIFTLLLSQKQMDIQRNTYANNQMDMQELAQIADTIRAYEAYHGIYIQEIFFSHDIPQTWQREGLRHYQDLTIRMLQIPWMPEPLLRISLGDHITVVHMYDVLTPAEIEQLAAARQSHWFTGGRLVFDGERVYLFLS